MMSLPDEYKKNIYFAVLTLLVVLSLFYAMQFLSQLKAYGMMGSSDANTITLLGYGEVHAVPDIANISFSISKDAKTVKEAQESVAQVEDKVLSFLKKSEINEKDIKTTNFSSYPKYEYQYEAQLLPCNGFGCPPRPGRNVIVGYTATESITVKIRDIDNTGKVIKGLGELGVSQLNGPNFTIDDEEALQAEARRKAISDAKNKAKILAKDLGVRLGRIASFSDGGNYPSSVLFNASATKLDGAESVTAQLPKGENTISSNVTITYEIR